ncbi:MAG: tRNA (adenosine(37)-N6)-threonylcarbamoyltransferase complex transferase subunit TsaD [Nitrososphaerota archaeon]|nr:tRNA (adenosine(37)-N6)-threonylcarbamoyltransferase complex transferase subunit TsaD [Nitrososphaerota archaeon]
MICLGIESTAHTFGAGVVEGGKKSKFRILSDEKDVYRAPEGSGIHPREASRHHSEMCASVVARSLEEAHIAPKDVDFIAYSAGPGLGPCLRVGAVVARSLASYFKKPLVPTNHAIGHIELGRQLMGLEDPLVLLISGGHTAIAGKIGEYWKIFGETLDLTLGQLLDQLGRHFGLSSPAGPKIEALALGLKGDGSLPSLPYIVKGNDVSYSGLLSAAKDLYTQSGSKELVAFGVQEVAFSMLVEVTERALAFTDRPELLVTGGVAANQRLASMLQSMCSERGVKLGVIPRQFAGDCGAQIAAAGILFYDSGQVVVPEKAFTRQSWRIDSVVLNN